jgi:hypothetical protein
VKARAHALFWEAYGRLPAAVQRQADKQFRVWQADPHHPSLRFKKVGENLWSARMDRQHRALARHRAGLWVWFWIGEHAEHEQLLKDLA